MLWDWQHQPPAPVSPSSSPIYKGLFIPCLNYLTKLLYILQNPASRSPPGEVCSLPAVLTLGTGVILQSLSLASPQAQGLHREDGVRPQLLSGGCTERFVESNEWHSSLPPSLTCSLCPVGHAPLALASTFQWPAARSPGPPHPPGTGTGREAHLEGSMGWERSALQGGWLSLLPSSWPSGKGPGVLR